MCETLLTGRQSSQPLQALGTGEVSSAHASRRALYLQAKARWSELDIPVETFESYLQQQGWHHTSPPFAEDLYLCCACTLGNEVACQLLAKHYLGGVRRAVSRLLRSQHRAEDAVQLVWSRLLAGKRARIRRYRGTGPLHRWLSVLAARTALDELRRCKQIARQRDEYSRCADWVYRDQQSVGGPEMRLFCLQHAPTALRALARALKELEQSERDLLQLSLAPGCTVRRLGQRYGVHPATAARRLNSTRQRLRRSVVRYFEQEVETLQPGDLAQLFGSEMLASFTDSGKEELAFGPLTQAQHNCR